MPVFSLLLKNVVYWKRVPALAIFLTTLIEGSLAAVSCFNCPDRVAYPRDCPFITRCGDHEVCFVDQFVSPDGNIFFRSGCRSKAMCGLGGRRDISPEKRQVGVGGEIKVCENCCSSDHCNYGGCGQDSLPPPSKRGPICYNCFQQQTEAGCNRITVCPEDCECHIMRAPDANYDLAYTTGCVRKSTCHASHLGSSSGSSSGPTSGSTAGPPVSVVGRRMIENNYNLAPRAAEKRAGFCFTCCPNDLCNRNCSMAHAHAASTTPPPTTTSTLTTTTKCPSDFKRYLNHCYYFSTDIKYWGEAGQLCKLKGGYLAKIDDQLEEDFIVSVIQPLGVWQWSDGVPLNYTNWGTNEPDHPGEQNFGFVFLPGHYVGDYKWGSHKDMQGTSRFICEKDLI
uniref:Asialoglycoprotein receptor 2 n=1 Tax=Magallana gigas TaxID=29159 RepID=K1PJI8_MAGGI